MSQGKTFLTQQSLTVTPNSFHAIKAFDCSRSCLVVAWARAGVDVATGT